MVKFWFPAHGFRSVGVESACNLDVVVSSAPLVTIV